MRRSKQLTLVGLLALAHFAYCRPEEKPIYNRLPDHIKSEIAALPGGTTFHLQFDSRIDGTRQPLLMQIPRDYTPQKSWPLLVVLHGLGDGPIIVPGIESMVQVGPFGRGDTWYHGKGEQDVLECVELAQELFNTDDDQVFLCGFSMGGAGTFDLGLKFPDRWAACVPVCGGISEMELVENGRNVPFWINTGGKDRVVPPQSSHNAYQQAIKLGIEQWKYTEYEDMSHSFMIDWEEVEQWLLSKRRQRTPSHVTYCSRGPSRAYWVELVTLLQKDHAANINARVHGQQIDVQTRNLAEYILHLKDAPLDITKEIVVCQESREVFRGLLDSDGVFHKRHPEPPNATTPE